MFSVLEEAREQLLNLIEDYTVTQVTLDDVFVNFAKVQEENQELEQTDIDNEDSCLKRTFLYKLFHRILLVSHMIRFFRYNFVEFML
jgi:hypothetical protein